MRRSTPEWDAIVVGAGPAGAATATRLAASGHRVLLLDRDEFPRPKACGECVSPAAVRALGSLGALDRVRAEPHRELEGWRIRSGSRWFEGDFPDGERGIAMPRDRLDLAVLEHARAAGAEIMAPIRATDLLREGSAVVGVRTGKRSGEREFRARLVVGADGLRSVVLRRLGLLRRGPRLRKVALTAHVRGLADLGGRGELQVYPWGCVGLAELGGGAGNVTVVVGEDEAGRVAGERERYFDRVVGTSGGAGGAERDGPVLATGPFDWPTRSAVADGALLVGDAAGYYDPFTGQGIYRALRGAELAAATASAALAAGDVSAHRLRPYDAARRREFGAGQRLQRLIEAFVSRPRLLGWTAGKLRRCPALADALIAVTADLAPVRTLARPAHLMALWA